MEAVDALARPRVHLVGHGRRSGLAGGEALARRLVARHQAQRSGERRGGRREAHEHRHGGEVEAARVDLAGAGPGPVDAEVGEQAAFEGRHFGWIALEQRKLVELGADRPLQATHRVGRQMGLQGLEGGEEFLAEHGQTLAEGRGLGGHVVGAGGEHEVAELRRPPGQSRQRRDRAVAGVGQRAQDLELLDVLGEVARGHPHVDVLVAGQFAELVDPRLHVVAGASLAGPDRIEVDAVLDVLVGGDGLVGHGQTQVALGLGHGDPQLALEQDAPLRAPDGLEGRAGVAFGEDVRNHRNPNLAPIALRANNQSAGARILPAPRGTTRIADWGSRISDWAFGGGAFAFL